MGEYNGERPEPTFVQKTVLAALKCLSYLNGTRFENERELLNVEASSRISLSTKEYF